MGQLSLRDFGLPSKLRRANIMLDMLLKTCQEYVKIDYVGHAQAPAKWASLRYSLSKPAPQNNHLLKPLEKLNKCPAVIDYLYKQQGKEAKGRNYRDYFFYRDYFSSLLSKWKKRVEMRLLRCPPPASAKASAAPPGEPPMRSMAHRGGVNPKMAPVDKIDLNFKGNQLPK